MVLKVEISQVSIELENLSAALDQELKNYPIDNVEVQKIGQEVRVLSERLDELEKIDKEHALLSAISDARSKVDRIQRMM
jgi:hypothetical protein